MAKVNIEIMYVNGIFKAFIREPFGWERFGGERLIFVAGGKVGDTYESGRELAEGRAIEFRELHNAHQIRNYDIGDIVFKLFKAA